MKILTTNDDFVLSDSAAKANLSTAPLSSWQLELKRSIRSLPELLKRLNLAEIFEDPAKYHEIHALRHFPVFVTQPFLNRIQPGNLADPLLLQVLPTPAEDKSVLGYTRDPLQEAEAKRGAGLLQKYPGRVLLIVTGACAIHCRYCFRRNFPYQEAPKSINQWSSGLEQIAADASIEEVILSGGDPLMIVDESLQQLIERLSEIAHLRRLRIHTRLPIMIPPRVTDRLIELLQNSRLRSVVVIHANHANELDSNVAQALHRLTNSGAMLLNQSVLLRGINDDIETLKQLSSRLLDCRVLPYYLHKNDPVSGTAHFEVPIERGIELIQQLREQLPGYAVPRFVQELAGEPSKTAIA
jgi:EF-P beta-lysylation protein EpmB